MRHIWILGTGLSLETELSLWTELSLETGLSLSLGIGMSLTRVDSHSKTFALQPHLKTASHPMAQPYLATVAHSPVPFALQSPLSSIDWNLIRGVVAQVQATQLTVPPTQRSVVEKDTTQTGVVVPFLPDVDRDLAKQTEESDEKMSEETDQTVSLSWERYNWKSNKTKKVEQWNHFELYALYHSRLWSPES